MIPSEKKELALYRLVKRSGGDDWWPTSIANLGNGVGSSDWKESVNVLKRLHHAGHIALRKHNGQKFEDYSPAETADVSFFYHGHFQILMTPSGLPYFERLEEIAKLEQVDSHPKSAAAHAQASPTLKWEKEVLEKIEALQNLMLGSVTGGERDEGEYRRIRDELFRMPGLKEALPRFVRTCGDLSQFWHFIKTQGNLGSYASRREYIWNAFRPLLAGVDDEAGIEREVFFAKGSDHDAYVHIRAILQAAKTNLFIIDPYMDGSIYQVLGTLAPATMTGRILTSKCPTDFSLENKKFMKQHPGFTMEVRTTKDFHDRFIILDQVRCYLLGASIKDAGNKGFTIVPLQEPSIVQFILNHANQVWASATPL